jgi:hypothetical protein
MKTFFRSMLSAFIVLTAILMGNAAFAAKQDSTTNPNARPHQIDRSAMTVQIQGWTHDLKYPVYPIEVMAGQTGVWYATKGDDVAYKTFNINTLACEIGKADADVLKNPKYKCADGVCFAADSGAIIGVDPRAKVKKVSC